MVAATTDEYELAPVLRNAADTFSGRKGGLLYAISRTDGEKVMVKRNDEIVISSRSVHLSL